MTLSASIANFASLLYLTFFGVAHIRHLLRLGRPTRMQRSRTWLTMSALYPSTSCWAFRVRLPSFPPLPGGLVVGLKTWIIHRWQFVPFLVSTLHVISIFWDGFSSMSTWTLEMPFITSITTFSKCPYPILKGSHGYMELPMPLHMPPST